MVLLEEQTYQKLLESRKQLAEADQEKADKILLLEAEVNWYREQLGLAKKRLYAPSSQQAPVPQEALLFNEAEACASEQIPDEASESASVAPRTPRGKREQNLADLPLEQIEYTLPEEEQVCPTCAGEMHGMGEDVRNEIKIIPAQAIWVRHERKKYACRNCERNALQTPIQTAPMPTTAFPNSLASPSAVAHILTQKFVEATPLYRQEQSLQRLGLTLSRQTMANWMLAGADWLTPVYTRMQAELLGRDILHADETPLQVLREPGRAAPTQSCLWLYRSGRAGPPIVLFEYQPTRAGEHAHRFLTGFSGWLHVDGYAGYENLPGVTLVGCWAHARRYFVEALNALPAPARKKGGTPAHGGLGFCERLFGIERDLREASASERHAGRQLRSLAELDAFASWLEDMSAQALPQSLLGKAIGYCRNQWPKLIAFVSDGRLEIDNNRSERSIKPFVIGRKNWLFANTPRGARASAVLYSFVETAKENGLDPRSYALHLFETLPQLNLKDPTALDGLLLWSESVQGRFRVPSKSGR